MNGNPSSPTTVVDVEAVRTTIPPSPPPSPTEDEEVIDIEEPTFNPSDSTWEPTLIGLAIEAERKIQKIEVTKYAHVEWWNSRKNNKSGCLGVATVARTGKKARSRPYEVRRPRWVKNEKNYVGSYWTLEEAIEVAVPLWESYGYTDVNRIEEIVTWQEASDYQQSMCPDGDCDYCAHYGQGDGITLKDCPSNDKFKHVREKPEQQEIRELKAENARMRKIMTEAGLC
jgi:hypothetical protein